MNNFFFIIENNKENNKDNNKENKERRNCREETDGGMFHLIHISGMHHSLSSPLDHHNHLSNGSAQRITIHKSSESLSVQQVDEQRQQNETQSCPVQRKLATIEKKIDVLTEQSVSMKGSLDFLSKYF